SPTWPVRSVAMQMMPRTALIWVGVVTVAIVGLPLWHSGSLTSVAQFLIPFFATVAILAIVTIGLNVQWGYTGIFNFGVVGFFMVGAYTAAILVKQPADSEFVRYIGGYG